MKSADALRALCAAGLLAFSTLIFSTLAASAQTTPARMATAANAFLATLSAQQRQSVLFSYDDQQQRQRWSNLPTGFVPRAGIKLRDMTESQRAALMALLSTALSARGYEKVQEIMDGDETLKSGDPRGGRGGGRGGPGGDMFGKDLYYVSFLGMPSATNPWMLQYGGHHLALNITVAGKDGVLTPTLTGAQPSLYTLNGKTVRPLGGESDKAASLFNSLTLQQKSQAILPSRVADLVLGPGHDGQTIMPEGLKATAMNESQRAMLVGLIAEWSGILQDDLAAARMREIAAGLNDTYFAWSGSTAVSPGTNITSYYRVQGPNLVIEYAPQNEDALHVHTMYRDPTNDYGRKFGAK